MPDEELRDNQKKDAAKRWDRIRNKYQNAKKINELSSTFGRIQPIVSELKNLANRFRNSAGIKRHLAYLYRLAGKRQDALKFYRETAIQSQDETDWYNLAVVARETENEELACYSLGQVFQRLPITSEPEAWYLYVHLLVKFNGHKDLSQICQTEHRKVSQKETVLLLETVVYLLKMAGQETTAREAVRESLVDEISISFFQRVLKTLNRQPTEDYQSIAEEISRMMEQREEFQNTEDQPPRGHVCRYNVDKRHGFIQDQEGKEYFFLLREIDRDVVNPELLLQELTSFSGERIPVNFQVSQTLKGLRAIRISRYRTIHNWYELAEGAANTGNYGAAISHIKQVLLRNKNYPNAQKNHEKWREYARVMGIPKGSNPFARAKRVQLLDQDLDKAEQYFRQAIVQNDNLESAVNDLAALLAQLERFEDAIKVIEQNRSRIHNQQSLKNLLTNIYKKAGMHNKAIKILKKQLKRAQTTTKGNQIRWQIANSYLALNEYVKAEEQFIGILRNQPDNILIRRNIALCLSRQERYSEAEEILNKILAGSSDRQSAELIGAVRQAKQTGEKERLNEIVIETELSDYSSGQISPFTQFFLDRCDFTGVPSERVQSGIFRDRKSVV